MTIKKICLLATLALAPFGAQAATLGAFDVTAATSERNGTPHSLWFAPLLAEGLDRVFTLSSPGSFIADMMGATMTGSVENISNGDAGFDFAFEFDRDFSDNDIDTPSFKAVWEDVMEHGNEDYFDFEHGTVTGTGGLAGLNFELVRSPADGEYVFQTGGGITGEVGANQHNDHFGGSGWMEISAVSVDLDQCTLCTFDESFYLGLVGSQSDVNVNLSPITVPVPAAGVMLLTALGGFGAIARRRRKS